MKKIAIGLMALMISLTSMAQTKDNTDKQDFKKGQHFKRDNAFEKLNLSADQKTQIKTLNEGFKKQLKALNQLGSITVDEQRTRRTQLVHDHKEKVLAVLTPEQRKQAETLKGSFAEGRRGHHGRRFEELTKNLNLSAEQSSKIDALNSKFKSDMQSLKENTAMNDEAKKEQFKSLREKHRSELESLLTVEQKEQLENNIKNRPVHEAVK